MLNCIQTQEEFREKYVILRPKRQPGQVIH